MQIPISQLRSTTTEYSKWTKIDKSLQCDHMELLRHLKSLSSLKFGHWSYIGVVVEDILDLKIDTYFD
jgi:hypothetical protein